MGRSKAASWIAGTAVLSLIILAAAWFLAISPGLDAAAATQAEAQSERDRADLLRIELDGLKNDFANIEEFRESLAALRVQLPQTVELANLTRQVDDLAQQSGVFISAMNPGLATSVAPPVAAVAPVAPAPVEGATEGEASEVAPTDPATPAPDPGVAAVQGLYAVQLQITSVGGYSQTLDFINRLQVGNPRLLLVTSFSTTAQEARGAEGGRPAVAAGDLETAITAYAYVLVDETAALVPESGEETAPEQLPVPGSEKNPFALNT